MRNPLRPMLASRRRRGRGHQPEIPPVIVGADEPQSMAMIDGILVFVLTRADQCKRAFRLIGRQHPRFRCNMAGGLHHNELAVARAPRAQIEALIVFLIDQHVVRVRRAADVPEELKLPLLFLVLDGVKERAAVRRPHDGADAFDLFGQRLTGFQIFDVQRVLAEAGRVGGVSQPAAIAGNVCCANRKKGLSLGQQIAVQNHLLRGVLRCIRRTMRAAVYGVLQTLFGARVIPPTAIAIRNRNVGLLYVREHLLIKLLAQAVERRHHCFGVGVLGFQIGRYFRILFVAQPGVVVDEDGAVQCGLLVLNAGDGRLRFFSHLLQFILAD